MNKEQALALYAKGKDAWNQWAKKMLARKRRLEAIGQWEARKEAWEDEARAEFSSPSEKHEFTEVANFDGFVFPGVAWFNGANFSGKATFSGATFSDGAGFEGATFSDYAWFAGATFSDGAGFVGATFSGMAGFAGATFSDYAWFMGATFSGDAVFAGATFTSRADFAGVTFSGAAWFAKVRFSVLLDDRWQVCGKTNGTAIFRDTIFHRRADFDSAEFYHQADFSHARFERQAEFSARFDEEAVFYAIDSKGGFTLTGTRFARVPNFIQAHFLEAPMLDGVEIPELETFSVSFPRKRESSREKELDSRLRGNDGEGRGNDEEGDKRGESSAKISPSPQPSPLKGEGETARYRTLKRMAIQAHDHRNEQNFFAGELKSMRGTEHQPFGKNWGWYWAGRFYEWLSDFGRSPRRVLGWMCVQFVVFLYAYLFMGGTHAACVAGEGNRFWSAAQLSLGKTLFPFGNVMDSTSHLSACLYGITKEFGQNDRWVPVIPDWFPFLSLTQSLFALLLIFLLLLAIRAHFRVK